MKDERFLFKHGAHFTRKQDIQLDTFWMPGSDWKADSHAKERDAVDDDSLGESLLLSCTSSNAGPPHII